MGYLRAGGPVRVSVDPMSKAGPLGKRPKVTGHASGQARPWRTGESTGENQCPGMGAPLALPPRGERGTRAPPLRYARRAPVVLFSSLESGQDPNPWLRAAALVFAVLALPGWQGPQPRPSGTQLAGRPRPARAPLGRSKPHPTRPQPGQSRGARRLLQLQIRSLRRGAVNTPTTAQPYFLCPQ